MTAFLTIFIATMGYTLALVMGPVLLVTLAFAIHYVATVVEALVTRLRR